MNEKKMIAIVGGSGFIGTRLIDCIGDDICLNIDKNTSSKYDNITSIADVRNTKLKNLISSDIDTVVLLAAEHHDNVNPISLYYDVNVNGTKNILKIMDENEVKNIVFTSSVAIYGLNKNNPDENSCHDPFNDYGKSKWQAEEVLREWFNKDPENRSLSIIRPTVVFGEANRGNVYNLLKQIVSGKFLMIGKGQNKKSMAYVGNVVAFIKYLIENDKPGYRVYNYVDKPDFNMNELIRQVRHDLGQNGKMVRIPEFFGIIGGYVFDVAAKITGKKLPISSVRVKKFCATTQFSSDKLDRTDFIKPYTIQDGLKRTLEYEFINNNVNQPVFYTE